MIGEDSGFAANVRADEGSLPCTVSMSSAATIELTRIRPPPLNSVRFFTEEQPTSSSPHILSPFPHTEEQDESSAIHPPWKRNLYQLLEQPTSSTAAFIMHMFTTSLIVMSAFVTVLETVPAVHSISTRVWFGVETSVVALFTVEYIARLLAWSNTWSTLFHWTFCTFIFVFSAQHAFITPGNNSLLWGNRLAVGAAILS